MPPTKADLWSEEKRYISYHEKHWNNVVHQENVYLEQR